MSVRLVLSIFASFLCISLHAIVPERVRQFYYNLKALETVRSVNEANNIQQQMLRCFYAWENSGIDVSMDDLGDMSSSLYTIKLFNMIYRDRNLSVNYTIGATETIYQPDQSGSSEHRSPTHYVTSVKKDYTRNGKTETYNDEVTTLISNGLIVDMENVDASSSVIPKPRVSDELNVEQLRSRAAYYYSKKQYETSYSYYERLLSKSPYDGDASYRIALLTFWRKGCKERFSRNSAQKKAIYYIDIAIKYGNYEVSRKASNVKKNWMNDNVYF